MNSKVVVLADETTGAVVNVSENPKFGYIRCQQTKAIIDKNGFLSRKVMSALLPGELEDLQSLQYYAGQVLDANIVIEESLSPFNKKDPSRDLKIAGQTGIVCTLDGEPIYRRTRVTFNLSETDAPIKHNNTAELQAAYEKEQATKSKAIKANEDFSIEA
jgi:hypothetical protein